MPGNVTRLMRGCHARCGAASIRASDTACKSAFEHIQALTRIALSVMTSGAQHPHDVANALPAEIRIRKPCSWQ